MVTRSRMSTGESPTLAAQGPVSRLRIPDLTDIDSTRRVTLDAREVKTSEEVDKQVKGFRMHPSAFIFGEQLSIDA